MARADLTVNDISRAGIDEVATLIAAVVDGHMIINDGRTFVVVHNGDVSAKTITFQANRSVDGLALPNLAISVPASQRYLIGPFPRDTFNRRGGADDGKVYIDYSAITSVTIAAFRLSNS